MNFIETEIIVSGTSSPTMPLFIPFLPSPPGEATIKDPAFVNADILNFASLAKELISQKAICLDIFGGLAQNIQEACKTIANNGKTDAAQEDLLLNTLNGIAQGPCIYKEDRLFSGIKLRERTRQLLGKTPPDVRLNRMLLEDAFPDQIAPDTSEKAVILGSGRYAIVALACNHSDPAKADGFYAVKFLKEDRRSQTFSNIGRLRFFEELTNVMKLAEEVDPLPVVRFVGFGRFPTAWNSAMRRFKANTYEETLENRYGQLLSSTALRNKGAFSKAPTDFRRELQGDFFVMELGLGTLDDVLFYNHPWRDQEIHKKLPNIRPSKFVSKLRTQSAARVTNLLNSLRQRPGAKLDESIGKRQAASGFRILEAIHSADPLLRYWIILDTFRAIAEAVAQLHSKEVGPATGYLAHRDLKPGNFLIIGYEKTLELALTDLGFVSGVESILRGTDTMGMSAKEPGVLTPGSYMFRAPEQIEAGFEIHFVIDGQNKKQLRLKTGPEVRAEVGDWIECDDLSAKASKLNMLQIVAETSSGSREQAVTLDREFEHTLDQLYYHGYLIKPSGQHSDIFALGSILYYIVSGGKNPEKFYQKCLEPEYGQVREAMANVYNSCFYLAAMLCLDHQNVLSDIFMKCGKTQSDPRFYDKELKKEEQAEVSRPACYVLRALLSEAIPPAFEGDGTPFKYTLPISRRISRAHAEPEIKRYAHSIRHSPNTAYFLVDTCGAPIPFPILYEIIKCLVRNRDYSYVDRRPPSPPGSAPKSYLALPLHDCAAVLAESIRKISMNAHCCARVNLQSYETLGNKTGLHYLLYLRMFLDQEPDTQSAATPAVAQQANVPQPKTTHPSLPQQNPAPIPARPKA